MKRMKTSTIVLVSIGLLLYVWAVGSTAASSPIGEQPVGLSLSEAIGKALAKNPMIDASQAKRNASAERIVQARSGFYPQLYASGAYQVTTNPMWAFGTKLNQADIAQQDFMPDKLNDPSSIDNFNTQIGLNWSIYNGGKSWHGLKQSDMAYQASVAGFDKTRQDVIARAIMAYTDLVYVSNCSVVVDQSLITAKAHLKMIEDRYNNGLTVKSDLLRARVHIAELEQRQVDVKSQILVAQAALLAVMDESQAYEFNASTPLYEKKTDAGSLDDWVDRAMATRPDFLQMGYMEKAMEEGVKKARAGHMPSLNVQGKYEINTADFDDNADSYTIGANVTVNLFSGMAISAQTREAVYRLNEIRSQKKGLALHIRLQTKQAYYMLQSAETRIHTAEVSIDEARETLRIVKDRYHNGQLSIVGLLDAELTLDRAKNNYFMALKDHMQARSGLELAAGTLDASFQ